MKSLVTCRVSGGTLPFSRRRTKCFEHAEVTSDVGFSLAETDATV